MRRDKRANDAVSWGRALPLVAVLVLAQVTIVDQTELGGLFRLDLPLLLVVAVATAARNDHAAVVGFGTGLAVDLFQIGPFGQHSLIYCLIAYALSSLVGGRGIAKRSVGLGPGPEMLYNAGARALVAGTATIFASCGLVVVAALVEPSIPAVSDVISGVPLGGLTGSILGIQLVSSIVRRVDLVPGQRWRPLVSWAQPSAAAGDAWQTSLSPIRRL